MTWGATARSVPSYGDGAIEMEYLDTSESCVRGHMIQG
jgi:hypothetical protein